MTFTADETRTTVLSYGFEGYGWDERTGEVTYSYFVPDGQRRSKICKKLIVIGADLTSYTLQGYRTAAAIPARRSTVFPVPLLGVRLRFMRCCWN